MFPYKMYVCMRTLLIVIIFSSVNGQDRKIISKLNPGCENCTTNNTLVYIKADGASDTIHQIWDFTQGTPTIIYIVASLTSWLDIVWKDTDPVKFILSEKPIYSFAAAIDTLYEYDDKDDNGHIDPSNKQRSYPLWHLSWRRNDSILTDKEAMVRVHGHYRDEWRSGIIDIMLDLLPFKDYAIELPHLIHTANSTLVDVRMVNLTTSPDFNSSRFALHFVMVSTDSIMEDMHYTMRKSLDDEHTPGVFEIIEIKTPESFKNGDGGFMQFRPVAYMEPERSVSSSTNVYVSHFDRVPLPSRSTLQRFYRDFDKDAVLVEGMFVSFGMPGDRFYKQHNFTAWSFTLGYGAPPIESFSLFVIMVIAIGVGVPLLLSLSGIIYILVTRYRQRNNPTRFENDEG